MPFPKGQKPPGSGRKPGSKNKRTLEIARRAAFTGKPPLAVMLDAMRYYKARGNLDKAAAFAKDAAPYMHSRLHAVAAAVEPPARCEEPIAMTARRVALAFRLMASQAAATIEGEVVDEPVK